MADDPNLASQAVAAAVAPAQDAASFAAPAAAPGPAAAAPPVPTLQCIGLTKQYSAVRALDNLTMTIPQGNVVGLLGPNGSGKTTLIKLIAGLLQPTAGTVLVCGNAPGPQSKALVSYLPERPYFQPSMKVSETLAFFQDFYADFEYNFAVDLLQRFGIPQDAVIKTLSKGTQEKLQLVLVMSRRAALYLLDEPIAGVDPATRDFILQTILSARRATSAILISTHLVADVEKYLDCFAFLRYGTLAAFSSPAQLASATGKTVDQYFREAFRC